MVWMPARADAFKMTAAGSLRAAIGDLLEHFPRQSDDVGVPKFGTRPHICDDANFCFTSLARDITECSVKADARGMDIGITTVGPIDEARHRVQQGLA